MPTLRRSAVVALIVAVLGTSGCATTVELARSTDFADAQTPAEAAAGRGGQALEKPAPGSLTRADSTTTAPSSSGLPRLTEQALEAIEVPPLCGHPSGRLVDGTMPGIAEGYGWVSLDSSTIVDLDDDGTDEAVVGLSCSAGGNDAHASAHLYGADLRHLGQVDVEGPHDVPTVADGRVIVTGVTGDSDDARCCPSVHLAQAFDVVDGELIAMAADEPSGSDSFSIDGWGSFRVGATFAEAALATGWPMDVDPHDEYSGGTDPEPWCTYVTAQGVRDGVLALGDADQVQSLTVTVPGIATPSGVEVGDAEEQVLAAYADAVMKRTPNLYGSVDDDVVVWAGDEGRVIRLWFDEDHRVAGISNGEMEFALLPEGCL